MGKTAAGLAVVLAVVVVGLWSLPEDNKKSSSSQSTSKKKGTVPSVKADKKLAEQGKKLSESNGCTSCHTIDGSAGAGPTWKAIYGTEAELSDGQSVKIDDEYISKAIVDPEAEVKKGLSPGMPSFKGKLSGTQIKAIAEYIKSLNG